jgi:hypothetical protein
MDRARTVLTFDMQSKTPPDLAWFRRGAPASGGRKRRKGVGSVGRKKCDSEGVCGLLSWAAIGPLRVYKNFFIFLIILQIYTTFPNYQK